MSLIQESNSVIFMRVLKKLLSFKVDRSELPKELDAVNLANKTGLVKVSYAEEGSVYTDEYGSVYTL